MLGRLALLACLLLLLVGCPADDDGPKADTTTTPDVPADPDVIADLGPPDAGSPPIERIVPNVTGLGSRWELAPHRLSRFEISYAPQDDGGSLTVRNDGGSFGSIDTAGFTCDIEAWRTTRLVYALGSHPVTIPPGSSDGDEAFQVIEVAELDAGDLANATSLAAFLRGFWLSTDEYETPPAFQTDPDLPYSPVDGFTTQGLGIALGEPTLADGRITVEVRARNSLGLSDRADMNAAIEQATSWLRVDFVVVGVLGDGGVTRGAVEYTISNNDYGTDTVHEHASPQQQRIQLAGSAGPAQALFGLTAFDFWLNVEERKDPSCVIVQDEINFWGEPVSGPGRYVRELSARLGETSYDPATGAGVAHLDLFMSNSSLAKEVGNLCLAARGEVAMVQFDDAGAERIFDAPIELSTSSGETVVEPVSYE